MKKPPIHLVSDVDKATATGNKPPPTLGQAGQTLWQAIANEYDVSDVGCRILLELACETADSLASLRAAIDKTGEVIYARNGLPKANPLLRTEMACRGALVKTLRALGLAAEPPPAARVGRPGGGAFGYFGDDCA
jgi:phage terminase small subunit